MARQAGPLLAAAHQAVLEVELQEFNTVSVEEWEIIRPSPEERAMQVILCHSGLCTLSWLANSFLETDNITVSNTAGVGCAEGGAGHALLQQLHALETAGGGGEAGRGGPARGDHTTAVCRRLHCSAGRDLVSPAGT